jgi:oxygen-independent coproporphyrinogen-3 oxidase
MNSGVKMWLKRFRASDQPINQIYLHIPFCPFFCSFCPLYKVQNSKERSADSKEAFVRALIKEIELYGTVADAASQPYASIYFGGGTPTELSPDQLARILTALRSTFHILPDAEITLEGVARHMLAPGYLEGCFAAGFNRLSYGMQTLNPHLRKIIGRGDDVRDYERFITHVRSINPNVSVNIDLMVGLPSQTVADVESDLQQAVAWGVNSMDVLYYVNMPGTQLRRQSDDGTRPAPHYGQDLLEKRHGVYQFMQANGFQSLTGEVFVREERDLFTQASFGGAPHAQNTLLALGPSGFGQLNGTSYQNIPSLSRYCEIVEAGKLPIHTAQTLDLPTARRRAWLMAVLRLFIPSSLVATSSEQQWIQKWLNAGLVERAVGGYGLTSLGRLWYNHMQMDLLPMLEQVKLLRMFSGFREQHQATRKPDEDLKSHERELLAMIRSRGTFSDLRMWAYKAYLRLRLLPLLDNRAIGFTGVVEK